MEFTLEEYELRCNKARKLMERNRLDGLFVTGECTFPIPNFRYFTGVQPREGTTNTSFPYVFLLPREGDPIIIVRELLVHETRRQTWVKDVRSYPLPFQPTIVKETIVDLNLQKGRIGAELGLDQRMHMPFQDFQEIKSILPNVEFVDASDIFLELRMVKTDAEVRMVRESCKIACRVYKRVFDWVKEGISLENIYKKARITQIEEGVLIGSIRVQAGKEFFWTELPHVKKGPEARILKKGELFWIDALTYYKGYWSDFLRMGVVGTPSDKQKKYYDLVTKMMEKTINLIKPGLTGKEIIKLACEEYRKLGIADAYINSYLKYPYRLLSHGIGLDLVERPYGNIIEKYVIQPGMTLSVEPCGGFPPDYTPSLILEDCIVVKEDGNELLTSDFDSSLHMI